MSGLRFFSYFLSALLTTWRHPANLSISQAVVNVWTARTFHVSIPSSDRNLRCFLTAALLKRSRQTGQWAGSKPPSGWDLQLCSQASLPQRTRVSSCVGVVPTVCCALSSLTLICPLASVPAQQGLLMDHSGGARGCFPCAVVFLSGVQQARIVVITELLGDKS